MWVCHCKRTLLHSTQYLDFNVNIVISSEQNRCVHSLLYCPYQVYRHTAVDINVATVYTTGINCSAKTHISSPATIVHHEQCASNISEHKTSYLKNKVDVPTV